MIIYFFTLLFISPLSFSLESTFQPVIQPIWSINTLKDKPLGPNMPVKSSPLLYKKFVIQGTAQIGLKAFTKQSGRLIWNYKIKGGVSSDIKLYRGILYFGAGDGFFYALKARNGKLIWKVFTGADNTGTPIINRNVAYFVSSNQKVYALSLSKKGQLLWIYSGPNLSTQLKIRGQSRPTIFRNFLYVGFSEGSVFALNKKTGRLLWKRNLKQNAAIFADLSKIKRCLLVPVFESGLYCLNFKNGKLIWNSSRGGATQPVVRRGLIYQGSVNKLYALNKRNGKIKWSLKTVGFPITPSFYKKFIIHGSLSNESLSLSLLKNRRQKISYSFGRGLSSPVTVDMKRGVAYFMSIEGYLHKIKLPKRI